MLHRSMELVGRPSIHGTLGLRWQHTFSRKLCPVCWKQSAVRCCSHSSVDGASSSFVELRRKVNQKTTSFTITLYSYCASKLGLHQTTTRCASERDSCALPDDVQKLQNLVEPSQCDRLAEYNTWQPSSCALPERQDSFVLHNGLHALYCAAVLRCIHTLVSSTQKYEQNHTGRVRHGLLTRGILYAMCACDTPPHFSRRMSAVYDPPCRLHAAPPSMLLLGQPASVSLVPAFLSSQRRKAW